MREIREIKRGCKSAYTIILDIIPKNGYNFIYQSNGKGIAVKYNRNVYHALTMISQFGINMLVPIFLCSFIGIAIDKRCGTSYWMVILFFVGALAGFTNVFRYAKKIYDTPAQTRQRMHHDESDNEKQDKVLRNEGKYEEEN